MQDTRPSMRSRRLSTAPCGSLSGAWGEALDSPSDSSQGLRKWALPEEFTEQSRALFASSLEARRPVLAPPHLKSEVTNAFYQRLRTTVAARRITEAEAERALAAFLSLPITLLAPEELYV